MAEGLVLNLDIDGVQEMATAFSRFGEYADDLREPYGEIADYLQQVTDRRFQQGGPGWAPLSPAYAAWKAQNYGGRPILVRTGEMRGGMGNVRRISEKSLEWGTNVPYAVFHQRGTRKMPQRRIIHLERDDATFIHKIIQRHLVTKARQAGLEMT